MKPREFWNAVPKPVQTGACAAVCVAVLIGLVGGIVIGRNATVPVLNSLAGIGIGLLAGTLIAIWVLGLGYVYADARRRAMPPVLWTLIAALIPNLLGFLLYFAMRRPIMLPCAKCGQPIATDQRFCSWCGLDKYALPSVGAHAQSAYAGLDPNATV